MIACSCLPAPACLLLPACSCLVCSLLFDLLPPCTASLQVIRNYHGHLSGVYCLAQHPTIDILMTGGRDAGAPRLERAA